MFSGYAPLSVRLVELVDRPVGIGWQNNEDVSSHTHTAQELANNQNVYTCQAHVPLATMIRVS